MRELLTLPTAGTVHWLQFHPDGTKLFVLAEGERAVRVWRLDRLEASLKPLGVGLGVDAVVPLDVPPAAPTNPPPPPLVEKPAGPNGLRMEMFADMDFRRHVRTVFTARSLGVDLREPQRPRDLPEDHFSIRLSGWIKAPRPGRYRLRFYSDDGGKVWIDGQLVFALWVRRGQYIDAVVELTGEAQEIRIDHFEIGEGAQIELQWSRDGEIEMQPIPLANLFHERPISVEKPPADR
jgi:hypothetical protein